MLITVPITEKNPLMPHAKAIYFLSESGINERPIGNGIPMKKPIGNIKPIETRLTLDVLAPDQRDAIKSATLHLLEHVGVHFPSQRALRVFSEHGAQVDRDQQIVRIAPELVMEALRQAPRSYTLSGDRKSVV